MKRNRIFFAGAAAVLTTFLMGYVPVAEGLASVRQFAFSSQGRWILLACLGFCASGVLDDGEKKRGKIFIQGIGLSVLLWCAQWLKNTFLKKDVISVQAVLLELGALAAGTLLLLVLDVCWRRLIKEKDHEEPFSFGQVSAYRSHLMGIAIILVMAFHLKTTGVSVGRYGDWVLARGYIGVDMFMLVSGLGMIFSLSREAGWKNFMKKRLKTVLPDYLPCVFIYSLGEMYIGRCGWEMMALNLTTLSFYTGGTASFNWYIPCILVFYALTPWLFQLMKNRRFRYLWAAVWILAAYFLCRVLLIEKLGRLNIGFSRFPIYILGMLMGFAIKENWKFGWRERVSLWLAAGAFAALYIFHETKLVGIACGHWLLLEPIAFVGSVEAAFILSRLPQSAWFMRALKWMGSNSLLLFLWNVILVRYVWLFWPGYAVMNPAQRRWVGLVMLAVNFLIAACWNFLKKKLPGYKAAA